MRSLWNFLSTEAVFLWAPVLFAVIVLITCLMVSEKQLTAWVSQHTDRLMVFLMLLAMLLVFLVMYWTGDNLWDCTDVGRSQVLSQLVHGVLEYIAWLVVAEVLCGIWAFIPALPVSVILFFFAGACFAGLRAVFANVLLLL